MAGLPKGIGGRIGLREQCSPRAKPIDLVELAVSGNRAQRRLAVRKIAKARRDQHGDQ